MNKKIKVIDLLNKIAKGEEVPKKIKCFSGEYIFCDMCKCYENEFSQDLVIRWNKLNDEVEILEDNTEEIEELPDYNYSIKENRDKINEIIRYIKRKDKNK